MRSFLSIIVPISRGGSNTAFIAIRSVDLSRKSLGSWSIAALRFVSLVTVSLYKMSADVSDGDLAASWL